MTSQSGRRRVVWRRVDLMRGKQPTFLEKSSSFAKEHDDLLTKAKRVWQTSYLELLDIINMLGQ
jgi:hypothetical protein